MVKKASGKKTSGSYVPATDSEDFYDKAHDGDRLVTCEFCGGSFRERGRFDQSNMCAECKEWERQEASRRYDESMKRRTE